MEDNISFLDRMLNDMICVIKDATFIQSLQAEFIALHFPLETRYKMLSANQRSLLKFLLQEYFCDTSSFEDASKGTELFLAMESWDKTINK